MSPDAILLALGSINVDFQVRADRWPEPGETMFTHDMLRAGGGKAANRAFLARRLGVPARLFGRIGDDDLAGDALRGLGTYGVDVTQVQAVPGCSTGVAMIIVRPDGDKTILLAPNANAVWRAGEADEVAAAVSAAPAGSVLTVDLEVPAEVVVAAVRAAHERGMLVVLDPSPAERMPDALYGLVDFITPNPGETRTLTGVSVEAAADARRAGETLCERGVTTACVKLPDGGCVVVRGDLRETFDAPKTEVVDKTGAGDAFAGALGVALRDRQELQPAVRFAVAAASLAVTGYGSQAAYPDRGRLERFLAAQGPRP
jgi:ribokinase